MSPEPPAPDKRRGPDWVGVAQAYGQLDPPLVPSPADLAAMTGVLNRARIASPESANSGWPALLLGVTPALANLAWPAETRLEAWDQSPTMVERAWIGDRQASGGRGSRTAMVKPWEDLPRDRPSGFACAVGDGSFNSFNSGRPFTAFFALLAACLRPGARAAIRIYLRPDPAVPIDRRVDEFIDGKWANPSEFKLLCYAALQTDVREGMRVAAFWDFCERELARNDRFRELATRHGAKWGVIESSRGSPVRMVFPTMSELEGMLPAGLKLERVHTADHATARWCPVLEFRRA